MLGPVRLYFMQLLGSYSPPSRPLAVHGAAATRNTRGTAQQPWL